MEQRVRDVLASEHGAKHVSSLVRVSGGCISDAFAATASDGTRFFVKANSDPGAAAMFRAESLGLQHMRDTHSVRVPEPFSVSERDGTAFFVSEHVALSSLRGAALQRALGEQLAAMHVWHRSNAGASEHGFGFPVNNSIGSTPQENTWHASWVEFWRSQRLLPMLTCVQAQHGASDAVVVQGKQVAERLHEWLEDGCSVTPALIHGDLWSGNVGAVAGQPCIFDPACYFAHDEAELGMTRMFGGFTRDFYAAYHAVIPEQGGKARLRAVLYQMYHELNHLVLFGTGYRSACLSALKTLQDHK